MAVDVPFGVGRHVGVGGVLDVGEHLAVLFQEQAGGLGTQGQGGDAGQAFHLDAAGVTATVIAVAITAAGGQGERGGDGQRAQFKTGVVPQIHGFLRLIQNGIGEAANPDGGKCQFSVRKMAAM